MANQFAASASSGDAPVCLQTLEKPQPTGEENPAKGTKGPLFTHRHETLIVESLMTRNVDSWPLIAFSPAHLVKTVAHFAQLPKEATGARQRFTMATWEVNIVNTLPYAIIFDDLFFFGQLMQPGNERILLNIIPKYWADVPGNTVLGKAENTSTLGSRVRVTI
ncbi:hypothetical protein BJ875DRAFT_444811 [Amylocarpus encephaloides]|uniref:Uncharacterized protein n=1 Tax=Amylocarpus encephaloides TaxID=45428 RepID=A0A9P8C355_9HELO|nr:hypothetical protein BJ875DRAFT_444811 [Amylocarpus encephaloides]